MVWIGTRSYGLLSFDPLRLEFINHPFGQELMASTIYSILDDESGNIWLSSNNGLYMYDIKEGVFHRYDHADGLQGNLFAPNASLKCKSGMLIFGGTNGFTMFHPDSIKKNPLTPSVFFTKILINQIPVNQFPDNAGNIVSINEAERIVLNHKQNVIEFELTALNYLIPEKNRFAIKLEGFDKNWKIYSSQHRIFSYSNLPPGNYRLLLNACNNDGIWNGQEKVIAISVLPHPWKSSLAYFIYSILSLIIIVIIYRIVIIRRNYMNQLRFEKFSKTKMAELNNLKIQFFTNIAHEFKTPLTLIISPLNKIMKAEWNDETTRNSLELVQRNAIRLQDLINQLMTFRALENNKVTIKNSYGDLVVFLNDLATLFKPLAKENSINFFIDYNPENYPCFFDHDKLEKIFYNLFSNAVKYTPNGGQINFQFEIKNKGNNALVSSIENMSEKFGYLEAKVINSGYQIPQEQVVSIFENTYQSGWADSTTQNSSGMGLTFTKELIKLLMGEITVKSNQAETCFKVSIPILASNELLNNHTMIRHQNPYYRFDYSQELLKFQYPKKLNNKTRDLDNKLPKVLIVEDNVDLQHFLNDLFCNDYHLIFASDGFEGLKLAEETNPVLVISDIMMPNMSGYELCKNIKMDIKTSHIPVILLSALNEKENKITGMEAGADVYIEKPFDPEYLILQVKNLIDSREVIRQAFSERIELEPDKATITSTDNIFIKRAIKSVENHMSHVEYNVDQLVSDMGLSRTLLYKKIKSLTNLSANEFIINIRMKRAAQLLRDSKLTVSEIAIEVGYREPSYFSTCFKKFFHVSPSKYHKHTFKGDMASSLGSRKSGIAQSPKI